MSKRKELWNIYHPPFTDVMGLIFDSHGNLVADKAMDYVAPLLSEHWDSYEGDGVTEEPDSFRIRGWGRIQEMKNAEEIQDSVKHRISGIIKSKKHVGIWMNDLKQSAFEEQLNHYGIIYLLKTCRRLRSIRAAKNNKGNYLSDVILEINKNGKEVNSLSLSARRVLDEKIYRKIRRK